MATKSVKIVKKFAVGVDLGGTNIAFALTDLNGKVLRKNKLSTHAHEGATAVIERVTSGVADLLAASKVSPSQVRSLGIGSPGPLNSEKGIIYEMPNLPGFHNTPMKALVQKKTGILSFLENDAKAAAFGEKWAGAGKKAENMLMLTLGTGLGGGIILGGKLYSGVDNTAGEFGHMVIDPRGPLCGCGRHGCLETYASATAIARRVKEALWKGEQSRLRDMVKGKVDAVTSHMVHQALVLGDALAARVWNETTHALGTGIANLINIFNPDLVVLGGGLVLAGKELLEPVRREVKRQAFQRPAQTARIVASKLGEDAGVIGAAVMGLVRSGHSL